MSQLLSDGAVSGHATQSAGWEYVPVPPDYFSMIGKDQVKARAKVRGPNDWYANSLLRDGAGRFPDFPREVRVPRSLNVTSADDLEGYLENNPVTLFAGPKKFAGHRVTIQLWKEFLKSSKPSVVTGQVMQNNILPKFISDRSCHFGWQLIPSDLGPSQLHTRHWLGVGWDCQAIDLVTRNILFFGSDVPIAPMSSADFINDDEYAERIVVIQGDRSIQLVPFSVSQAGGY